MIRTGDIVLLRHVQEPDDVPEFAAHCRRFAEIGPGKKRSVHGVTHEVFRLEAKEEDEEAEEDEEDEEDEEANQKKVAEYAEDSVWVRRSDIVAHFPVASASDFHEAWNRLGFLVQEASQEAALEFVFRFDPDPGNLPKPREEENEDQEDEDNSDSEDLRSIDSYSTISDDDYDSSDSFVVPDSTGPELTYSPNSGPQSI